MPYHAPLAGKLNLKVTKAWERETERKGNTCMDIDLWLAVEKQLATKVDPYSSKTGRRGFQDLAASAIHWLLGAYVQPSFPGGVTGKEARGQTPAYLCVGSWGARTTDSPWPTLTTPANERSMRKQHLSVLFGCLPLFEARDVDFPECLHFRQWNKVDSIVYRKILNKLSLQRLRNRNNGTTETIVLCS